MDGQRQRSGGGRRRRRKAKAEPKAPVEPVLIVARRPDSPLLSKLSNRNIAASAQPKKNKGQRGKLNGYMEHGPAAVTQEPLHDVPTDGVSSADGVGVEGKPRRVARIAQTRAVALDERQARRQQLLERLTVIEGRSAISRVADELLDEAPIPEEQQYQVQLLEHVNEERALAAIEVLSRLLSDKAPIKRPILERRLRRLEDEAEEAAVRERARDLRRQIRAAYPPARAS